MKLRFSTLLILISMWLAAGVTLAQENSTLSPTPEALEEEKAEKERQAFTLLEQVVQEAQILRLPENRARVQLGAATLLWQRDQGRARSFLAMAGENVAEMMRQEGASLASEDRRGSLQARAAAQLRQELVLTAARYDAALAYQLLASTRPPTPVDSRNPDAFGSEDILEQRLLAEIAALDPKLAFQNAEQMLDKGQFPRTLPEVLAQLQSKDKEAAAKLEDKISKRLQSGNILSNVEAGMLALSLLRPGPRTEGNSASGAPNSSRSLLAPSSYNSLLSNIVEAALRATAPTPSNRTQGRARAQTGRNRGGAGRQPTSPTELSAAEMEQNNAFRLMSAMPSLLPQIDQYLPARAQAVRQKMTELKIGDSSRGGLQNQFRSPSVTSDALMAMASQAPPQLQPRVYQQAAMRALNEGNPDLARQIANDHLESPARDSVLQAVEFRQTSEKAIAGSIDEVRQTVSALRSDEERVEMLLRLSGTAAPNNRKLALEILEEARLYTNRRASNYQQFDQQLRVAAAFKDLEPSQGFDVLEPVVMQLNELLAAAATLSGFELNMFRDGELPLEGRNRLSNVVMRYGAVLGQLAESDFDRSQTLASRFQFSEPRLLARLAIVRGMLGKERIPVRSTPIVRRVSQ